MPTSFGVFLQICRPPLLLSALHTEDGPRGAGGGDFTERRMRKETKERKTAATGHVRGELVLAFVGTHSVTAVTKIKNTVKNSIFSSP